MLQVICTAHSKLSVNGQPRGGGKEYLAMIAKDGEKKGFFIRIVDKEVRIKFKSIYLIIIIVTV